MKFRRKVALALGALILAAGCSDLRQSVSQDPSYEGRKLSNWLRDFDGLDSTHTGPMAAEAVRHIGVAAVPLIIDYLSPARNEQFRRDLQQWQASRANEINPASRPFSPRFEALAALDALGSLGTNALPVLDELLHEDPFDPHVIYVVARMGLDGMPLLTATLSSTNKQLRLEAGVGLDLIRAHSEVLYPAVPVGPDAPCFQRRITEFNLKIMQAAFQAYRTEHADAAVPAGQQYPLPPPRLPE